MEKFFTTFLSCNSNVIHSMLMAVIKVNIIFNSQLFI